MFARAIRNAFDELNFRSARRKPTLAVIELAGIAVAIALIKDLFEPHRNWAFDLEVVIAIWATALATTLAPAWAKALGKAHADTLRREKGELFAKRLDTKGKLEIVSASRLCIGDTVLIEAGDLIPGDGDIVEGIASVDESAITGESAPVIRESGGARSAVSAGARVLSDHIKVRITSNPAETLLDRMAAMVEGEDRDLTPDEISAAHMVAALTLGALLSTLMLAPLAMYAVLATGDLSVITVLASLAVCFIPTIAGALLPAISIAGLDRVLQHGVLTTSANALEAASLVDIVLLDKTGTITLGNREAVDFIPLPGVEERELAEAAVLTSLRDETPEGRSVVVLARARYALGSDNGNLEHANFIPFSAYTRMSGVDIDRDVLRKGAAAAIASFVHALGGVVPEAYTARVNAISRTGGTPLGVANGPRLLGIIDLRDIVKAGTKERMSELRRMGMRPVMITGDNPITAEAIAHEAGMQEVLAQATPADKLTYIKREQTAGRRVAMTGDGTNDAPALAQADVGLVMGSGTLAAQQAGNMVDLSSDPTKLIEVARISTELRLTRRAFTAFSVATSVIEYVLIVPVILATTYPIMERFKVLHFRSMQSAVLSALVFNVLACFALMPVALRGVPCTARNVKALLRPYVIGCALAGLVLPVMFFWIIEHLLGLMRLV